MAISSITDRAHASILDKFKPQYPDDITTNHLNKTTERQSAVEGFKEAIGDFNAIIEWFKDLPEHITTFVTGLTDVLYNLISSLILKTPLWMFDNSWFNNTTHLFSILAIGIVTILTMIEGFKRKLKKNHVPLKKIVTRWFWIAGLYTAIPYGFLKSFQILNYVTDQIVGLSSHHISNPKIDVLPPIELIILLVFNIVLLSQAVPIIMKNARRFFDILTLAITSPLALTAWIFDPFKHLFSQWWSNLKRLSLVQLVYAFYLMVIGLIIYGIPTPDDFTGMAIKMMMVVGGFARMVNPPAFVQRYLDSGKGIDEEIKDSYKDTKKSVKDGLSMAKNTIMKPYGIVKSIANIGRPEVITKPNSRMGRIHGR